jgi:hypothetical protein
MNKESRIISMPLTDRPFFLSAGPGVATGSPSQVSQKKIKETEAQ